MSCDKLDSPAVVIQSLYQADSFPCSVSSLGRTNLFKALDTLTSVKMPMATRNLTWATGKREISASPQTLQPSHTPLKPVHRIYPGNRHASPPTYTIFLFNSIIMGHLISHKFYKCQRVLKKNSFVLKHLCQWLEQFLSNFQLLSLLVGEISISTIYLTFEKRKDIQLQPLLIQ